ncbi:MAG: hypothetical protein HRU00_03900 [Myxococcales bacterium]|nr:hypothetical protein [Myxococcales bacterium]
MKHIAVFCASLVFSACGGGRLGSAIGLPGSSQPMQVTSVVERYVYLDAGLETSDIEIRLLVPRNQACSSILVPEASINYVSSGILGSIQSAGQVCTPLGVASIQAWLDFQQLAQARGPIMDQSTFRSISEDPELIFLRGRFPSATLLRFGYGGDMVALIPNRGDCAEIAGAGVATLQYNGLSDQPYSLLAGRKTCPITGFAIPTGSSG